MNAFRPTSVVFVEFRENSMHVLERDHGFELPVVRDASGHIVAECAERLRAALHAFAGRKAHCSIPARGVSLRNLSLPTAVPEEIARLLPLQIEARFPMPPAELAWGYSANPRSKGKPGHQDVLVAAVKRDVLNDYRTLLTEAGLEATFTIGAIARCALAANPPLAFSFLDADQPRSELISFDSDGHAQLRAFPTNDLGPGLFGEKVYITSRGGLAPQLANELALNGSAELIETGVGPGQTAANLGLKELCEKFGAPPLTILIPEQVAETQSKASPGKWLVLAAALLFAFLALRALEPTLRTPRFAKRLAEIQQYRDSLPSIERELAFLQYIKTNQPPFLDAVVALAGAAPRGTRFESVTMARRGDLTVRGSMDNPQGATEFRAKLIDSGLFAKLVLEEQAPVPNSQKLTFRLNAQLNPADARKPAPVENPVATNRPAARQETNHAKLN